MRNHNSRIRLAEYAGFCAGVRRAVAIAAETGDNDKALGGHGVATLGPLVHNPHVVASLEQHGVVTITQLDQAEGRMIVIPSHGLPPNVVADVEARDLELVDATCPHVKRVQKAAAGAQAAGRTVILVGDAEHPEVRAVAPYAGSAIHVVADSRQVRSLDLQGVPVTVLAQTTQKRSVVCSVVEALQAAGSQVEYVETICPATTQRQNAARLLAAEVDLMVVIGGKASANTMRLAEVCRDIGVPVLTVESATELDPSAIRQAGVIGVTAGASTPSWVIEEVMDAMNEIIEGNPEQVQEVQPVAEERITPPAHVAPSEPEILKAHVEEVYDDRITVQLETGETATVFARELGVEAGTPPSEVVSAGDEIAVVPDRRRSSPDSDELTASKRQADRLLLWKKLENALETGEIIEGQVTEAVKGGLVVNIGVRGFVPASQVGRRFVEDLGQYVGQTLRMKVREVEQARSNVVLSQRAVLEEEEKQARAEAFATLQRGQVLHGKVTRLATFGAFVDIGNGVEGLLHISDIAWTRIKHPSKVLSEGQEIDVQVLNIDSERERISLGYKQLQADPWENIAQRFPVNSVVRGTVTKLVDFGAFVSLADGVEGLVHISQLSDKRIARPDEVVSVGDQLNVKIIGLKEQEHRISLSVRQAMEDGERSEYRRYMKDQKSDEAVTIGEHIGFDLAKFRQSDEDNQ